MPELRAALVMMPPLLVDLITATLAARLADFGIKLEIFSITTSSSAAAADVAILGPGTAARALAAALFPPAVPVLSLSADFTSLLGPDPGDSTQFTPENLAKRLRDLRPEI